MKYLARLVYKVSSGQFIEQVDLQHVYISGEKQKPPLQEMSQIAHDHLREAINPKGVSEGQIIYLQLAGSMQVISTFSCNEWCFDISIEWSSLDLPDPL